MVTEVTVVAIVVVPDASLENQLLFEHSSTVMDSRIEDYGFEFYFVPVLRFLVAWQSCFGPLHPRPEPGPTPIAFRRVSEHVHAG